MSQRAGTVPETGGSGAAGLDTAGPARPDAVRVVADVDELKALADPTRLSIIEALMEGRPELPVMSVKELAEKLGQPQTKLYRHVRVLESVGLIRVAASRMVSGILEQRYQASQRDLQLAPRFLAEHVDESEAMVLAVIDRFRAGFFGAFRARSQAPEGADADGTLSLMTASGRLTPAKAAEVRAKLQEALAYFDEPDSQEPDAVEVNMLVGVYLEP